MSSSFGARDEDSWKCNFLPSTIFFRDILNLLVPPSVLVETMPHQYHWEVSCVFDLPSLSSSPENAQQVGRLFSRLRVSAMKENIGQSLVYTTNNNQQTVPGGAEVEEEEEREMIICKHRPCREIWDFRTCTYEYVCLIAAYAPLLVLLQQQHIPIHCL